MELVTDNVRHAESPRWSDGELWFSDTHGHAVKRVVPGGEPHEVLGVPRPSGLGRLPDGRWLVISAGEDTLNYLHEDGLTLACDLSPVTLGHAGDMVVDGRGRAYISDTGFDHGAGEEHRLGQVLLFTESGGLRVAATDTDWANGSAVSADGSRFFLAETFGERISVFSIDDEGGLSDRRVFAELGTSPDGLCLDADGGLWVGLPFLQEFAHVDAGGRVDRRLPSRGKLATACVLGGDDRRTLFVCSVDATAETLSRGIVSGGFIECTTVEQQGVGWP